MPRTISYSLVYSYSSIRLHRLKRNGTHCSTHDTPIRPRPGLTPSLPPPPHPPPPPRPLFPQHPTTRSMFRLHIPTVRSKLHCLKRNETHCSTHDTPIRSRPGRKPYPLSPHPAPLPCLPLDTLSYDRCFACLILQFNLSCIV